MHDYKTLLRRAGAVLFWLAVWQAAAMAIGQEVFLVSPVQALRCLLRLLPQADFWHRVGFSAGRILLGFGLGVVCSAALAVAAEICPAAEVLIAPVLQLVKATPVASFIILALVWVRGSSLSVLISFLMVLPVLYGAVRTGIRAADPQLLEMAKVFRLPLGRRLRAVWLPAVLWAPSGWGKTTFLHILMGLETPTAGRVQGAGRVSAVFQEDRLCPQLTAVQNVLLVLPDDRQEAAIRQDFARLGLDEAALALPARKLSGGQKRRTALLRALWAPGDTLLLDEPFTGMDPAAVQASIALLRERVEGRPVLLATHDRAAIDALGWPVLELQKLAQPGTACNSTNKGLQ